MSNGLESFNTGWDNNQDYVSIFSDFMIDSAGLVWILVGSLNTQTNAYTSILSFVSPNFGMKLAVVVQSPLGVSLSPIVATITYHNQSGTPNTVTCSFPQGSGVGTCEVPILPGGEQISSVTIASVTPTTSGTIQFWAPISLAETFDSNFWGPPDPGL